MGFKGEEGCLSVPSSVKGKSLDKVIEKVLS